jgi:drug/metabolite transporter, DME family
MRVVLAGACWGLAAIIAKTAFDRGVSPVRMAEARVVVALVVLAAFVGVRRRAVRPPPGTLPVLVAFGLCVAGVNAAYYVAIDRLAVGVAISLQYTGPVLLLGLAALTAARKPGAVVWVAGACTLAGAVLVSQAYAGLGRLDAFGTIAALASAFLFGGYLLSAELAGRRGADPLTILLWGFAVAVVTWTVAAPWWSWPVRALADPDVTLAVLGVGIVGTLVPFFLSVGAVRVLSLATAGIAATVEPPFAAAFAWILLGQRLTPVQLVGGLLVLAGVVLARASITRERERIPVEMTP